MLTILALALSLPQDEERPKVLFLTHSAGFRHDVIPLAEKQLAAVKTLDVTVTQDCGEITAEKLKRYAAVVFYTTGELPIADPQVLVDYVKDGGGFVGIHCATDTLYKFAPYGEMIGGYFDGHPWTQKVRVRVEDLRHPATAHLGKSFEISDEIYQFRAWDRKNVRVLLSLEGGVDFSKGKREDKDYAIAWTRPHGKGRVFYTALGHGENVWKDPRFLEHLVGGIEWAARARGEIGDDGFEIREERTRCGAFLAKGPKGEFFGSRDLKDADRLIRLPDAAASYHVLDRGWKMAGPGGFEEKDGVLTARGGMGLYWNELELEDFLLFLEWKVGRKEDNSGVFVRFPDPGNDPWIAVNQGYEIQICDPAQAKHRTGSIYSFHDASHVPTKAVGEWNGYQIMVVGQRYTIRVNGELVAEFTGDRSRKGFVGLQNHDDASRVSYRNVRVVKLK